MLVVGKARGPGGDPGDRQEQNETEHVKPANRLPGNQPALGRPYFRCAACQTGPGMMGRHGDRRRSSVEHEEQGDRLEAEAERMEEHSGEVGEGIEEAREDWESKQQDPSVPGAQRASGEEWGPEADPAEREQHSGD